MKYKFSFLTYIYCFENCINSIRILLQSTNNRSYRIYNMCVVFLDLKYELMQFILVNFCYIIVTIVYLSGKIMTIKYIRTCIFVHPIFIYF